MSTDLALIAVRKTCTFIYKRYWLLNVFFVPEGGILCGRREIYSARILPPTLAPWVPFVYSKFRLADLSDCTEHICYSLIHAFDQCAACWRIDLYVCLYSLVKDENNAHTCTCNYCTTYSDCIAFCMLNCIN